jgi:lipopolysaccharide exporter
MSRKRIEINEDRNLGIAFSTDVLRLVTGTSLAQVISVIAAPILTRLYLPEDFGVFEIFLAIITILAVVVCLRYQFAILIPKEDGDAVNILGLSIIATILMTFLAIGLIVLAGDFFLELVNAESLESISFLIPITLFFEGILLAFTYWGTRRRFFNQISVSNFSKTSGMIGAQLGLGHFYRPAATGLTASYSFGVILSSIYLAIYSVRRDWLQIRKHFNLPEMIRSIARYKKFPMYDVWAVLLNSVSWQLPAFLLSSFFGTTIVGFYALGHRLLRLPMSLIGNSISQVFFQRASIAHREGNLAIVVEDIFGRLVTIGLLPFLCLTIIGEDLFILFFGAKWAEAGVYVQLMAIWTFFWFISSPLSNIFRLLERQEFSLKINMLIFITRLLALVAGGLLSSPRLAIGLFAVSGLILYGYLGWAIFDLAELPISRGIRILTNRFTYFIPLSILLLLINRTSPSLWLPVLLSASYIAAYLFLKRNEILRGIV